MPQPHAPLRAVAPLGPWEARRRFPAPVPALAAGAAAVAGWLAAMAGGGAAAGTRLHPHPLFRRPHGAMAFSRPMPASAVRPRSAALRRPTAVPGPTVPGGPPPAPGPPSRRAPPTLLSAALLLVGLAGEVLLLLLWWPVAAFGRRRGLRGEVADQPRWAVAGLAGAATPLEVEPWSGVRWLPKLDLTAPDTEPRPGEQVLPCFPLEAMAYLPESRRMLNIIEKRYRQMYSDILFNGSRQFVVAFTPPTGLFDGTYLAEVGVVFYLEELEDVAAQTLDRVKWRCQHSVRQRVRIVRPLNPAALGDRSTYMRVVVEELEEAPEQEPSKEAEEAISDTFRAIVELQRRVKESPRFEVDLAVETLTGMGAPGKDGLWRTARLWQSLLMSRVGSVQQNRDAATLDMLNVWMQRRANGETDFVKDTRIDWAKMQRGDQVTLEWEALPPDLRQAILEMHRVYDE
eukprot:EG_transcript_12366